MGVVWYYLRVVPDWGRRPSYLLRKFLLYCLIAHLPLIQHLVHQLRTTCAKQFWQVGRSVGGGLIFFFQVSCCLPRFGCFALGGFYRVIDIMKTFHGADFVSSLQFYISRRFLKRQAIAK